jgi:S1-C subfamily serine protease
MKLVSVVFLILLSNSYGQETPSSVLKLAGFSSDEANKLDCKGSGTGFAITREGHIITAYHVIKGSKLVRVTFKSGKSYNAEVLKTEPSLDLAVVKVDAKVSDYLRVARRTSRLGDDVYTIGYPDPLTLGSNQKFNKGSISSITGANNDSFLYQISVPVQPGNSGGPLVCDETGEVTGIIVWRFSEKHEKVLGYSPQLINYALKSAFISPVLDALEITADQKNEKESTGNQRKKQVVDSVCLVTSWVGKDKAGSLNDVTPPQISILGNNPLVVEKGFKFTDLGATSDGGELVSVSGEVKYNQVGVYKLIYKSKDAFGNIGTATRIVEVVDTVAPTITLRGNNPSSIKVGEKYFENGAVADGNEKVTVEGFVNIFIEGMYEITYRATDDYRNSATAKRIVYVLPQSPSEQDNSQDQVSLTVTLPMNNHGGTIGAALVLGTYKLRVSLDGSTLGFIPSGKKSGTFTFVGSGERMVKLTLEQTAFLGITKTQKIIYSELLQLRKGSNEIAINGNLFLR